MKELTQNLHELKSTIKERLEEDSFDISKKEVTYVEFQVSEIEHREDGSVSGIKPGTEEEIHREWDKEEIKEFIENEICSLGAYKEALAEVEELIEGSERSEPEYIFKKKFLPKLVISALESDEQEISRLISLFLAELNNAPLTWNANIWLSGVGLESEEIEIGGDFCIRRAEKEDFNIKIPYEDSSSLLNAERQARFPSSIIGFKCRAEDYSQFNREIELILKLLRLYASGSIYRIKTEAKPSSILKEETRIWTHSTSSETRTRHDETNPTELHRSWATKVPQFSYTLLEKDRKEIENFIQTLKPKLSEQLNEDKNKGYLNIAIERYEEALKRDSPQAAIASAITALEAVLLGDKERSELSHRLSQRSSVFLGIYGEEPIKIYRKIKSGYEIRSDYFHGSKLEDDEGIQSLAKKVLEYVRVIIVTFLQLEESKGEIINRVDKALLDEKAESKLENRFDKMCGYKPSVHID